MSQLYGLPFDGIRGIRQERMRLEQEWDAIWDREVQQIKERLRQSLGYRSSLGLLVAVNRGYAPVVWADMASKGNQLKDGLQGERGRQLMGELDAADVKLILDLEFRRIHLNYAAGLVLYRIARLKRLEQDFDLWRRMMRVLNET